ncbi:MAG: hypothetical protein IT258_23535 [Saprospiraceae bacterium]|nr:hypothetical protein [Saprospiraceae bacterium]
MNHRRFFSQLLLVTILTAVILYFLHIFQPFAAYATMSAASLVFFAVLAVVMYFPSVKAAQSADRNAFTRAIMGFSFLRMFLAVAFVVAFVRLYHPTDKLFTIPFFFIFFVFTGFDVVFMSKLGRVKVNKS